MKKDFLVHKIDGNQTLCGLAIKNFAIKRYTTAWCFTTCQKCFDKKESVCQHTKNMQ